MYASLLLLAACTSSDSDSGTVDLSATIELTDANNYVFNGSIDVPVIQTASATNVHIDWARLLHDLQCHGLDPAEDIDNVALIPFPELTTDEVQQRLNDDDIQQSDVGGYLSWENEIAATDAWLTDLTFFGTDPDIVNLYTEGSAAWLLLLTTGTELAVGARTLAFLDPRDDESSTEVVIDDACELLDFTVDLHSLEPVPIAEPGLINWSAVTTNGRGQAFSASSVDQVMIAQLDGLSVSQIEEQFLDTELLATNIWSLELTSVSSEADLGMLTDSTGAALPTLDPSSTWILGLRCTRCANPAPLFQTILDPR